MTEEHRPPRWFVYGLLGLFVVPGVVGFELWPLTGWRLFSLSRDDTQHVWVLEAEGADGDTVDLDFEDLPLAYRNAAWVLDEVIGAGVARKDEVCLALFDAANAVAGPLRRLRLVRDHQRLVVADGRTTVDHDRDVVHGCTGVQVEVTPA